AVLLHHEVVGHDGGVPVALAPVRCQEARYLRPALVHGCRVRGVPRAQANGIELEYDAFGDPSHPAILLIMGLGIQMLGWDEAFCQMLVDRGYFVIRFDNRDVGLSSKIEGGPEPNVMALMCCDFS